MVIKLTKRLKIAYALWGVSAVAFIGSIFKGKLGEVVAGCFVLAGIGFYFYKTKDKAPKKKKTVTGYSINNLPDNAPIVVNEIEITPNDNFLSVLKKKRYGDKWNGLSIADAKEDIKTGYEDYYFEFEPWEVEAIIEYPTAKDGRKYSEDELKDISEFEIYLDEEKEHKTLLGYSDSVYEEEIQRILLEDGVVVLTIYVYGGNCMYLNLFKELEVTKDVPLQYKVEINQ